MKVLLDFHHHALAESYALTLHDRLGWDIWFPWGMDWFDDGVWQFERAWHGDRVARQYLEGFWADADTGCCTARMADPRHPNRFLQGVSLQAAMDMADFDIVISSLPDNDRGYANLAEMWGAKFGVQVGNNHQQSDWKRADFIISSSTLPGFGTKHIGERFTYQGKPAVMVHQEFDTEGIFYQRPPVRTGEVQSWVNCFGEGPSYPDFLRFARAHADDFDFVVYGALGSYEGDEFQAGDVSWVPDIADLMGEARVGWHTKHWSDGFGHVIHNWFAIGRPVVGYARYYKDKLAGLLWDEGGTSFDIEHLSHPEQFKLLRRLRDDDDFHADMCENAAERFRSTVDWKHEADIIKQLVEDA